MCYSKINGGYRCMPPQKLLAFYRGGIGASYAPRQANGAFWLNGSEPVPHLLEIEEEAYRLRTGGTLMIDDEAELEHEVSHLGHMIARYSDAQVVDFDIRLKDAQNLGFQYLQALRAGVPKSGRIALYRKAVDANLAISYESRARLQETLAKISAYGKPLEVKVGDELLLPYDRQIGKLSLSPEDRIKFIDALKEASKFYPSSWNQALDDEIALTRRDPNNSSYFLPTFNEISISDQRINFASYASLEKAKAAKAKDGIGYDAHVQMVHELGHKFEAVQSDIVRVSRAFLRRRGLNARNRDLHDGGKPVLDHFTWDYVGRLYKVNHTEVFTVGMESTLRGTRGAAIGLTLPNHDNDGLVRSFRPDVEHRNLTLGILASMHMPFNNDNKGKPVQTMFGVDVDPLPKRGYKE